MNTRQGWLLALGALLAAGALLLSASFYLWNGHQWYWNWYAAPVLSIIGTLAATSGGYLIGRRLAQAPKRRWWLIAPGGILSLACLVAGLSAFALAFPGLNYFPGGGGPVGWDSYYGDYLVGWLQIRLLQLAVVSGIPGGWLVGVGLGRRPSSIKSLS